MQALQGLGHYRDLSIVEEDRRLVNYAPGVSSGSYRRT